MMLPIMDPVDNGAVGESRESDEIVIRQVWISFVSLLRSHLGALQTTGKLAQAHFVALSDYEIEVVDLARTLHISLHAASGEGEWSLTRVSEMIAAGVWILRPDATAGIDQGPTSDMEFAIEALVEKLWTRTTAMAAAQETAR